MMMTRYSSATAHWTCRCSNRSSCQDVPRGRVEPRWGRGVDFKKSIAFTFLLFVVVAFNTSGESIFLPTAYQDESMESAQSIVPGEDDGDVLTRAERESFGGTKELMTPNEFFSSAIGLSCISCIGIIANGFVIFMYCYDRQLRTPVNMILFNVVIGDFTVAAVGTPFPIASALNRQWYFGEEICVIYAFFMAICGICSISTLAVLAFERYLMISRPLGGTRPLTGRRAALLVAGAWLYSLAITAPPLLGWGQYTHEAADISCSVNWETREFNSTSYILFLFVFGLIIPVLIILWSYIHIVVTVYTSAQQMGRASRSHVRVSLMVFAMIVAFLLAWTPYSVFALIAAFGDSTLLSPALSVLPSLFAKSSVCYNPFIYVALNTQFRATFKRMLGIYSSSESTLEADAEPSRLGGIAVHTLSTAGGLSPEHQRPFRSTVGTSNCHGSTHGTELTYSKSTQQPQRNGPNRVTHSNGHEDCSTGSSAEVERKSSRTSPQEQLDGTSSEEAAELSCSAPGDATRSPPGESLSAASAKERNAELFELPLVEYVPKPTRESLNSSSAEKLFPAQRFRLTADLEPPYDHLCSASAADLLAKSEHPPLDPPLERFYAGSAEELASKSERAVEEVAVDTPPGPPGFPNNESAEELVHESEHPPEEESLDPPTEPQCAGSAEELGHNSEHSPELTPLDPPDEPPYACSAELAPKSEPSPEYDEPPYNDSAEELGTNSELPPERTLRPTLEPPSNESAKELTHKSGHPLEETILDPPTEELTPKSECAALMPPLVLEPSSAASAAGITPEDTGESGALLRT